jgi:uncharacterized protein (TIGR02147 family)
MEHIKQLEKHFNLRKAANSLYSMRAYARDLGLEPSTLSKILKGQRGVPFAFLEPVTTRLGLKPKEKEDFFSSVLKARGYGSWESSVWSTPQIKVLKNDLHFQIISEWEHYALLNLMKLKDFQSDVSWISDRLGLNVPRCKKVIENLLKTSLIRKDEMDQFYRCYPKISSSDDVSAAALKMAHQNDLKMAASKVWSVPIEQRDFCSMTIPTNVKNLKKAKLLTRKYVQDVEKLLESGEPSEIYQLSVQLFPLSTNFKRKLRGYQ